MRLLSILAIVLTTTGAGTAAEVDLHAYWDGRCASCHGHAADFARRFLKVTNGKLRGRHHVDDLDTFLANHHLSRDLVVPVTEMLAAQVTTEPRFRNECGRCHPSAADLARKSLSLRGGVLVGRAGSKPTTEFLAGHAGIKPEDVPFFVDVLTRVVKETGGN